MKPFQVTKHTHVVCWIKWNRDNPKWRPIYKFIKCENLVKAERLKNNLIKQTSFIEVYITKLI
jgi:hypothetical protein